MKFVSLEKFVADFNILPVCILLEYHEPQLWFKIRKFIKHPNITHAKIHLARQGLTQKAYQTFFSAKLC